MWRVVNVYDNKCCRNARKCLCDRMCPFIRGSLCGAASGWIWCTWCLIKFLIVLNFLGIFSKNCHGRIQRHDTDTIWYYWHRQAIWWYQRFKFHSDFLLESPINVTALEWFKWRSAPGYSAFLERFFAYWLDCPRLIRHHVMPLDYERLVIGNVFSVWGDSVHWGGLCSLNIHCVNFSAIWIINHMQTMSFKECKAYVYLEIFWKCIFCSKTKFARMWY